MMESFNLRKLINQGIFVLIGIILLIRLFFMQVMDPSYQAMAKNNVVRNIITYPSRGLIYDRNDSLLVTSEPVYDLMVIPKQTEPFDTLKLCQLLGVNIDDFYANFDKIKSTKGYSPYKPQVIFKQIPADIYTYLQEYLYQFPGFYTQVRTVRVYHTSLAGHIMGYIGEANQQQVDTSDYYHMGDYVGINGIEKSYEKTLRGEQGIKYVVVDVRNREIGKFADTELDKEAIAGSDLHLTLDMELQEYCERIMSNKKGAIVAIEPATGEILALVSSPTFDPRLLTGKFKGEAMQALSSDPEKPLFNRALSAYYPPGSIFKPIMALMALQEGLITPNYYFPCYGGYKLGSLRVKCHPHAQCYSVQTALEHSCNAYFCHIFKIFIEQNKYEKVTEGLRAWKAYLAQFSLGTDSYVDIPGSVDGYIPGPERYDRMYGKRRWKANSIISLGIGQGEIGMTPLQMAHSMAIIANRGYYYHPHVIKPLVGDKNSIYIQRHKIGIDTRHFAPVIDGMHRVVVGTKTLRGTGYLDICGKTGTAQNPHGRDHSLFAAFAPKNNPQIAVAVIIENAGWGYKVAAPIASLVIEKYINRKISGGRRGLEYKMMRLTLMYRTNPTAKLVRQLNGEKVIDEPVKEVSDDEIREQFSDGEHEDGGDEYNAAPIVVPNNDASYSQPVGPSFPITQPPPAATPIEKPTPAITTDPPPTDPPPANNNTEPH